jgi:hypothetical protein
MSAGVTKVPGRQLAVVLAAVLTLTGIAPAADTNAPAPGPAALLYQQLGSVGLDPARVYRVRDVSIERPGMQLTLEDGTIAFTKDVMGRITGAFFEGDGELLVSPPNEAERQSMSLFTGMAILEERFATAYLRFNDNTAVELASGLRATEESAEFLDRWKQAAESLAPWDALRLLQTFSRVLPASASAPVEGGAGDVFLHARLQGAKLGLFDVIYDASAGEPVEVGQARKSADGVLFYDVWTSFSPTASSKMKDARGLSREVSDVIHVSHVSIRTHIKPPKQIEAEATLEIETRRSGERTLMFELSRFIRVEAVERNGHPVEFIHNPSVEGTQLARHGNDVVAVVLDQPTRAGETLSLKFVYHGEVLAEAGPGLLYVGARGNWYPNRGLAMSNYDLEFYYPPGWTLLATGKPSTLPSLAGAAQGLEQMSRWISERPIPVAGFNLGKFKRAVAHAGPVTVESYGAVAVERDFPTGSPPDVVDTTPLAPGVVPHTGPLTRSAPSPALNTQLVADASAEAIRYYADRFGPFPYSQLALTQLPGPESQGWPGLIFLSSFAFLTDSEREALHKSDISKILERQIPAHETAHQWWGDLITWRSYRDQWFSEALANYCSLMELEERNPAAFRQALDYYRTQLLKKSDAGTAVGAAGPVTLGGRLVSSRSPEAYDPIVYGRGPWLIHMLRMMLGDAERKPGSRKAGVGDELFFRSLLNFRRRYEGGTASTQDLIASFEENLPPGLKFEGKRSLDWFLHGWVEGTAIPRLGLRSVKLVPRDGAVEISGVVEQKNAPADLVTVVPVYAMLPGNAAVFVGQVFADGEETAFRLTAPSGATRLSLDPQHTVLSDLK